MNAQYVVNVGPRTYSISSLELDPFSYISLWGLIFSLSLQEVSLW
jgi:hypothetical protein